jgi:cytochrome c oxidase subunit 2
MALLRRHRRVPVLLLVSGTVALCGCGGGGGGGGSSSSTRTPAPTRTASGSGAATGKQLAASNGCTGCHSIDGSSSTGPTWKGLAGSQVQLTDGKTVTADTAYLTTAIDDPDGQIVKGFQPGIMSGAVPKGSIPPAKTKALVAYIKTLR